MAFVRTIFFVCIFSFAGIALSAQEAVHVIKAQDVDQNAMPAQKWIGFLSKFSFSPYYSSNMGLGVALGYAPSKDMAIVGNITSKGYALLGVKGNRLSKGGKLKFNYNAYYGFTPVHFWGTGYLNGNDNSNKMRYDKQYVDLQGGFVYYTGKKFYLGPSVGYEHVGLEKFGSSNYFKLGFTAGYDSRNNAAAAERGINAVLKQRYYIGKFAGTAFVFDTYCPVWRGGVLAFDLYSEFTYSQVPWYEMPSIGGSYRMRGYYKGRYRDNNMVTAQLEIRQHIWEIFSAAAWVGAGNVWGSGGAFSFRHTLPNYGIGFRIKTGSAMALRFDWGFGKKGQNGFILGINEAF